jgi:DNA-binding NtrC family response regulator
MMTPHVHAAPPPVKTILLVEDDAPLRKALLKALKGKYHVLPSKDGVEAVMVFEKNLCSILAVVTDLEMPRLSGDILTEWIHSIRPDLPVILTSATDRIDESLSTILKSHRVRFLAKPFDLEQLEQLIEDTLS